MRNLMYGVALAAFMITTPVMACTDWKAIAVMDTALLSHGDNILAAMKGAPADLTDVEILRILDHDVAETRRHVLSALDDKCAP